MVKLKSICQLEKRSILVVGDLILDTYTTGKANRISPEAPVAVVHVHHEESLPGGAGNVALNLVSLDADVVMIGRVGEDDAGRMIRDAFLSEKINIDGLVVQRDFKTPVKNRVIADNQQLVRIDYERVQPISKDLEKLLIESLPKLMQGVDAVAISDYGKGFLSDTLLHAIITLASSLQIPVIADPKGKNFGKYNGVTILKPNLSEAYAAAEMTPEEDLSAVAEKILKETDIQTLMITRSKDGISIFEQNKKRTDFPVNERAIKDVTGAGDTVLATLTYAIANELPMDQAVPLSNIAAGIAIERVGCARVSLSDLVHRLIEHDVKNKIFDDEHSFALQHALKSRHFHLLALSGNEGMTTPIFTAIHQLTQNGHADLIIYLFDPNPNVDFIDLLASIQGIKFIIIQHTHINHLCNTVKPVASYALLNNELVFLDSVQDLKGLRTDCAPIN